MKIVVHATTNTVGTDSWYFIAVDDDIPTKELDDIAQDLAHDNAEMYGIYPPPEDESAYVEDDDGATYDDSIGGSWYHYEPELHDMYTCCGEPSWQDLTT